MLNLHTNAPRLDVVGTGFTVLDRIYADGILSDEALGGSCANVLVSLAMLGHHVAPVLRLGADDTGARLVEEFAQAGAVVEFISQVAHLRSPILAEEIDTASARHGFSFHCPITNLDLPRYEPIGASELVDAASVLGACAIFYTDRLTSEILDAMRIASRSGAHVVFEPSALEDQELFAEALRVTTILKTSADRLAGEIETITWDSDAYVWILTHGQAGLELRAPSDRLWCPAILAPRISDACGSGDMVTVGLLDGLLKRSVVGAPLTLDDVVGGVVAGQHLAAVNCGFEGARGVFRQCGPTYVRALLDGINDSSAR
jgi:fructokinase